MQEEEVKMPGISDNCFKPSEHFSLPVCMCVFSSSYFVRFCFNGSMLSTVQFKIINIHCTLSRS